MEEKKTEKKPMELVMEKNPMEMTEEELYRAVAWKMKKGLKGKDGDYGYSKYLPLIFERMLRGPEDARILLNLPGLPADIAPKVGMTEEEVESRLNVLGDKAVAWLTRKGWFLPRSLVAQLHDAGLCVPKYDEEYGEEFFLLWQSFCRLEYWLDPNYYAGGIGDKTDQQKFSRVMPDHRALAEDVELAPWEDLKAIFDILGEDGKLGAFLCSCGRARLGDPKMADPWKCIVWRRGYDYWNAKGGCVKTLNPDEMMAKIDKLHENGLVTTAPNGKNFPGAPGTQMFCNCHINHCDVMLPAILQGHTSQEVWSPSRYRMTVKSTDDCKACQKCVDICIFGAAQMKYVPDSGIWHGGKYKAWVDPDKCMGCGNCALVCPINNRVLELVRPAEHVPDEAPKIPE